MEQYSKLETHVSTEKEIMEVLDLTKKQLDYLRWNKGFPYIQLQRRVRVYMDDDVFEYLQRIGRQATWDRMAKVAYGRTKDKPTK